VAFRNAQILDAIIGGVVVVDRSGRVEDLNAEASRLLETSDQGIEGKTLADLLGRDHQVSRIVLRVLGGGSAAVQSDVHIERRFAENLQVELSASAIGSGESQSGCLVVLRDLTAQRKLLQQSSERERHASFGKIASGLAHEIKNPLSGIRGAGELIAARSPDEKSGELADLIVAEATRITRLVDEFMVFTTGGVLSGESVNVHEVLNHVLALLEHDPVASRIEIHREYDPSIPEFVADRDRLTQIFMNVLRNAYQALNDQAEKCVRVRTRVSLDHRIAEAGQAAVPTLAVSVIDNGPGFPKEILPEATTPFVTGRAAGTGLGLAISEYWVNLHGGAMSVGNEVGGGARVSVILPLRRPDPEISHSGSRG
jgi:two-component system nitrogen regulation sensor histidine kinase GlnL